LKPFQAKKIPEYVTKDFLENQKDKNKVDSLTGPVDIRIRAAASYGESQYRADHRKCNVDVEDRELSISPELLQL
jgi:hypothetical protein